MKKYVKPELFFENFELSQQIAACQFDSEGTKNDVYSCSFMDETGFIRERIFANSTSSCKVEPEVYCEHNGSDTGFNIFNS